MPETPDISRVTSRAGAEDLIGSVLSGMRELEAALGAETAQVRVGRIRDGLAPEAKKGELAARYLLGLEAVKANAVALARFAPEAVDGLRAAHAGFGRTVEENRIVLATARAVSEGLIKSLSEEITRASRPMTYGPATGLGRSAPAAAPLVVSRSL
ncbi:MAG: hypothetical protein ACJ8C8_05530 [Microvirga sp.]